MRGPLAADAVARGSRAGEESERLLCTTCLFLSGKAAEEPRRVRDVLNAVHHAAHGGDCRMLTLDETYFQAKADVIDQEQRVLRALAFDPSLPASTVRNRFGLFPY